MASTTFARSKLAEHVWFELVSSHVPGLVVSFMFLLAYKASGVCYHCSKSQNVVARGAHDDGMLVGVECRYVARDMIEGEKSKDVPV
jgi:hypothetical protein